MIEKLKRLYYNDQLRLLASHYRTWFTNYVGCNKFDMFFVVDLRKLEQLPLAVIGGQSVYAIYVLRIR